MATYLLKTEPDEYSYDDLDRGTREPWSGVSSPAARQHMRRVKKGDEAFIYHTGKEKAIVGLARVLTDAYEDPADPGLNGNGEMRAPLFEIGPLKRATTPVTLAEIKADERFGDFDLVRITRLSVMLVPPRLDKLLRKMAGL